MNEFTMLRSKAKAIADDMQKNATLFRTIIPSVMKLNFLINTEIVPKKLELKILMMDINKFYKEYHENNSKLHITYGPNPEISSTGLLAQDITSLINKIMRLDNNVLEQSYQVGLPVQSSVTPITGKKSEQCVFIGHGRSKLWFELKVHLMGELKLKTIEFESESRVGESVVPILEKMLDEATFAVIVMTAEDETETGGWRARQNVIHEVGLFQGRLGFSKVAILMQNGVERFSNIDGLQYIPFDGDKIDHAFDKLRQTLKREKIIE
ncbi:MAG: nucleotide-binding protein [Deltaproteobacteria bacterium]|nr:nucleotide-binding protein [Deltaproteobacteria bacterium]